MAGLLAKRFEDFRQTLAGKFGDLGYETRFTLANAVDFGVPQTRHRVFIIALQPAHMALFQPPEPNGPPAPYVGDALIDLMKARGWPHAEDWQRKARGYAPTVAGGSKKHGGADLSATQGKLAWLRLATDAFGVADVAPGPDAPPAKIWNGGRARPSVQERREMGLPMLTPAMIARLQGFPDAWRFCGKKTSVCRQIGNALPPPVACAVGRAVAAANPCRHGHRE